MPPAAVSTTRSAARGGRRRDPRHEQGHAPAIAWRRGGGGEAVAQHVQRKKCRDISGAGGIDEDAHGSAPK
jgi:hypothetical protein